MMKHPYEELERMHLWQVVDRSIEDLVANRDIVERTPRVYIVGNIVKKLIESGELQGG
jgi:hypothetical protein